MRYDELKNKALSLPLLPGVYIMKSGDGKIIYVGKAKKLKNRVSQYFQSTASHSQKTKQMVRNIDNFETIVAESEFEALVLECSLIKRYAPKYNILLKDDKGYPYIRLNMQDAYPRLSVENKITDDGALYFGPFGTRGITISLLDAINSTLGLPTCTKKFPKDIGISRPCLNYHMKQCAGWCQGSFSESEYRETIEQAHRLLQGEYKSVADEIRRKMLAASELLNFELAAYFRDKLKAVACLRQKQLLVSGSGVDTDVIGYAHTDKKACFAVLHFRSGDLVDKESQILKTDEPPKNVISSLIKQYYIAREVAPKMVLLPVHLEDSALLSELLLEQFNCRTRFKVPQRGENIKLIRIAEQNAQEELNFVTDHDERTAASLALLGKMLSIPAPNRIESFDISNLSGTDIVASMVVFCSGKPKRSEYKRFKINGLNMQDDYQSMRQAVERRFSHYLSNDNGFDILPDLLLIDGGCNHAKIVNDLLIQMKIHLPVLGMVKDDRHRTRALITSNGEEIRIDSQQAVFSLIGNIQEETHNFAIRYHRLLRSKRMRYSELETIPNIGKTRKEMLLRVFKSISGVRAASLVELEQYLPKNAAKSVYEHFHKETKG